MAAPGGSAASAALRGLIQQFTAITGEARGRPGPAPAAVVSCFTERICRPPARPGSGRPRAAPAGPRGAERACGEGPAERGAAGGLPERCPPSAPFPSLPPGSLWVLLGREPAVGSQLEGRGGRAKPSSAFWGKKAPKQLLRGGGWLRTRLRELLQERSVDAAHLVPLLTAPQGWARRSASSSTFGSSAGTSAAARHSLAPSSLFSGCGCVYTVRVRSGLEQGRYSALTGCGSLS